METAENFTLAISKPFNDNISGHTYSQCFARKCETIMKLHLFKHIGRQLTFILLKRNGILKCQLHLVDGPIYSNLTMNTSSISAHHGNAPPCSQ